MPVRVLAAMSGGVDSSVAAALLCDAGHEVVGATMKLWGGESDSGCCSVSDVDDARRVCHQIGIDHHVFNFGEEFGRQVVEPYVDGHRVGLTPNPCIECNRHIKFDRFTTRARQLGFDAVATGHHARVVRRPDDAGFALARGRDRAKDQSYVLSMLGASQLEAILLPVGEMTKDEVRTEAARRGLRTAVKPDSQDVCFITAARGRADFLGRRLDLRPARLVDGEGAEVGSLPAVELVTIGQRRGIGAGPDGQRRYVVSVDCGAGVVRVGDLAELMTDRIPVGPWTWAADALPAGAEIEVQVSAHGPALPARMEEGAVVLDAPARRVAPGQTVAAYRGEVVVGSALAQRPV